MTIRITGKVLDENMVGLSGAMVSNGEDVIQTSSIGKYSIEADPGVHSFLFLTVPDGYRAAGSFFHPVPEASGNVDFELETAPSRANPNFTLAQITDIHVRAAPYYRPQGAWLGPKTGPTLTRDLRKLEREARPDLIVCTGDLTDGGTMAELKLFRDSIAPIRTSIYPIYGGHDGTEELTAQGGSREGYDHVDGKSCVKNYQKVLGPVQYSFDRGGRHFVVFSKEDSYFTLEDVKRKDRWLLEDLARQPDGRESVVLMHTPPSVEFLDQLERYKVTLLLFGHTHCSKVFTYGSITAAAPKPLCFGGYDTGPRGYLLVRFTDGGFKFETSPQSSARHVIGTPTYLAQGERDGALRLRWKRALPGPTHRAELVPHGGNLIASVSDDSSRGRGGLYSVDVETGQERWSLIADASVKNSVALDKGIGAAVSIAGQVYGFEAISGAIVWRQRLPMHPERWIYTRPAIADGTVYTGAKAGYGAYDLETGEQLWYSTLTASGNFGDPVGEGWGSYPSPQVYGDLLILLLNGRALVALDRRNGAIVWEQPLDVTHYYPTPALTGELLVSGGSYEHLAVLRAETGEVLWHEPVIDAQYPTSFLVEGERLYMSTNQGSVRCLALESGKVCWDFQSGDDLLDMNPFRRGVRTVLARPLRYKDMLVICGVDGVLYLLHAETGSLITRTQFPAPITAAPTTLLDGLCVATWDGRLYRFEDPTF